MIAPEGEYWGRMSVDGRGRRRGKRGGDSRIWRG